jgi:1,4-alpha-glucan branching enzyme
MHGKLHRYVKDLNHLYLDEPCFWQQDHARAGFRWINPDDSDTGIVSFIRYAKDPKDYLVFICNFTPIGRAGYVIGVPDAGEYEEVLNSDAEMYGGTGACHELPIVTLETGWNQWPHSIAIGVPPLGFLALRHRRDS